MYWWMKGDLDKAIELSEKALENGCRDKNLYVNLCTYLLEKGDYKEYRKYIKDCNDKSLATPAILDLEAAYYMIQKDWKKAGTYLTSLLKRQRQHIKTHTFIKQCSLSTMETGKVQ